MPGNNCRVVAVEYPIAIRFDPHTVAAARAIGVAVVKLQISVMTVRVTKKHVIKVCGTEPGIGWTERDKTIGDDC